MTQLSPVNFDHSLDKCYKAIINLYVIKWEKQVICGMLSFMLSLLIIKIDVHLFIIVCCPGRNFRVKRQNAGLDSLSGINEYGFNCAFFA